jgi:carboxyl-terminal processing protease
MNRVLSSLLAFSLLVPLGVEAQAGTGSAGRTSTAAANRAAASGGAISRDEIEDLGPEAQVFLSTLDIIRDYALEPRADSLLWEEAIDGLIKELNDPYATVLSPDEVASFEEQSTGNYAGIGIGIEVLNAAVTITKVFPNTPADHAGLMVGDRIAGVNEDEGDGWSTDDASNKIRGEPGTTVTVYIDRDGFDEPRPFAMERAEVHAPAVQGEHIFDDLQYLLLERVTRNSAVEVDSVLSEMGNARGLIFDLRRNPGGYLDESLNLADLFLDRGSVLVTTRSRARGTDELQEESARARMTPRVDDDIPIVVLVDRYSASAAEIVAGALQDHDRALVLGERSFGKGTVQSVIPLPGGRLIRITSGQWFTPQGRMINRPRDAEGRPIEQADSVPEYKSVAGRTLIGGGGIFPDLEVADDTLTTAEQGLMQAATDAEFPIQADIQETALTAVQEARDAGNPEEASFPADAMDGLYASILESGIPEELLTDETRGYLRWRVEVAFYQRLGREDRALEVRSERDTVLGTAIRLLRESQTQEDLFALAEAESEARAEAQVEVRPPSTQASN